MSNAPDLTMFFKMIVDCIVMILDLSFCIAGFEISVGSFLACCVLMAVLIYALTN